MKCQIKAIKITALTRLKPLVVKVSHPACMCEGVAAGMHEVPDPASAGRHQAMDQTKKENEVGKCSKQDCN